MAVAYITSRDFLFWFRSHTAKEIKWGGAKHHPEDKDDGQRMHPRSSFKAFLEVVKRRSLSWETAEMDAIHSLQLILRDSFKDSEGNNNNNNLKAVVPAPVGGGELQGIDELSTVAREMVRLIETTTAPIFVVDVDGCINGWNAKVAELTGLPVEEAMEKSAEQVSSGCSYPTSASGNVPTGTGNNNNSMTPSGFGMGPTGDFSSADACHCWSTRSSHFVDDNNVSNLRDQDWWC